MPTEPVILIGAGGHATVVLDAIGAARGSLDGVVLADAADHGHAVMGCPVIAPDELDFASASFHVSIGDNRTRRRLHTGFEEAGGRPKTIVHPAALVSRHAELGPGVFVAAGAVIGPLARIGAGTIINHNAVVDHECTIGAFCHVAPCASLAGRASLGDGVLAGAGARILPGVGVGDDAVVGAGAVVRQDIPARMVYAGVPARRIK